MTRLQKLKKKYKMLQMEDHEHIANFINRVRNLANQMATCGKDIPDRKFYVKRY